MKIRPLTYYGSIINICVIVLHCCLFECTGKNDREGQKHTAAPIQCQPEILDSLPHDQLAFTQGLCYMGGILYESTGLFGSSSIRAVDTSGAIYLKKEVPSQFFAEGCALFKGNLFQLTWRKKCCFVYSLPDLLCNDTLFYEGEGWGLTADGTQFIMSNGSDTLYFRNDNFTITKKLSIIYNGKPLNSINELEYVNGSIFANVWHSDFIFEIDPNSGTVERTIDCSELVAREAPASNEYVLNGIAYNPERAVFYLTGKNWKTLFVVTFPE